MKIALILTCLVVLLSCSITHAETGGTEREALLMVLFMTPGKDGGRQPPPKPVADK